MILKSYSELKNDTLLYRSGEEKINQDSRIRFGIKFFAKIIALKYIEDQKSFSKIRLRDLKLMNENC